MTRRRHAYALAFLLMASASAHAAKPDPALAKLHAAAPLSAPAEVLRLAAPTPLDKDAATELLLTTQTYRYDVDHRLTRTMHYVVRVLDGRGVDDYGTLRFDWAPWVEARPVVRARVVTAEGRELQLDPATITEAASRSSGGRLIDDTRQLVVPLPGVARGATIELVLEVRAERPRFDAPGASGRAWLWFDEPTHLYRLRVESASKALRAIEGGFEARGLKLVRNKPGEAPHFTLEARPAAWPKSIGPGEVPEVQWSTGGTWQDMARAYDVHVQRALASPPPKDALPRPSTGTRRERAQQILAAVQARVRYTGLELGESAIVPYTPAEVWAREYGDCKDMAVLLVQGLAAAGVDARVALLDAGTVGDVQPDAVGLDNFDHAIVYVPAHGGEAALWIDPTAEHFEVGVLPYGDLERRALVIDPGTTDLIATAGRDVAPDAMHDVITVDLAPYGEATRATLERRYEGTFAANLTGFAHGKSADQLAEAFHETAEVFGAAKAESVSVASEPTGTKLTLVMNDASRWITDMRSIELDPRGADVLESLPDDLLHNDGADLLPFRFVNGLKTTARTIFRAPLGFSVASPLGTTRVELGPVLWQQTISAPPDDTRVVEVETRMEVTKLDLTRADVKAFVEAHKRFTGDQSRVVFRHDASTLVESGAVTEGLAAFRAHLAKHPDDAATRARFAIELCDMGVRGAAEREAAMALERDPKGALPLLTAALVASADPLGRTQAAGWDRDKTVKAYRKVVAAFPLWPAARLNLATALERDANAALSSSGPDLEEAIGILRKLAIDDAHEPAQEPYALASWRAGKAAALVADSPKMTATHSISALWLAAVAVEEGPTAAARAAATLEANVQLRALEAAVSQLIFDRRYALALALGQATLARFPGATNTARSVGILPQVREQPPTDDLSRPEGVYAALFSALAAWSAKPGESFAEVSKRFVHPDHHAADTADEGDLYRSMKELGGVAFSFDLLGSVGTVSHTGSDATGFRVRMDVVLGTEVTRLDSYWARTPKGLRLVTFDETSTLGEHALLLLAQDDLGGARQWLDWAREAAATREVLKAAWEGVWPVLDREPTRDDMNIAAAALALTGSTPSKRAIDVGLAHLARWSARAREAANRALILHAEPTKVLTALRAITPRTAADDIAEVSALVRAKRFADAIAMAEARVSRDPGDTTWQGLLAMAHGSGGNVPEAKRRLRTLVEQGHDGYANNYAWSEVVNGTVSADVEHYAQRAVAFAAKRPKSTRLAALNTLAFVQIELGRLKEAAKTMELAIPNGAKLDAADHLLLARMAEATGSPKLARAAYDTAIKSAPKGDKADPMGVEAFAKKRLAGLGK